METILTRVLIEILAVIAQLALVRLVAWLRERSTALPEMSTAH